jgi:hypothetical protein
MRLALAIIAVLGAVTTADAGCLVPHFRFSLGYDTTANMVVTEGWRCSVALGTGAWSSFESVTVSTPPGHGTVTRRGSTTVTYQPRRGFRGEDSFAIAVRGLAGGQAATSTIRMSVEVR